MKLTEVGEARVRGYLFLLGRSLRASLPRPVAVDALAELESHVRERVAQAEPVPNEEAAIERVLGELGAPLKVAQMYSAEMVVDEALVTGGVGALARAFWRLATLTIAGFLGALSLFIGYALGVSFLVTAALKPILPNNVGLFVRQGVPIGFGVNFPVRPDVEVWGGYWVIPVTAVIGLAILVATHRLAQGYLEWWRGRHARSRGVR